jgi:hypothetical protein
MGEAIGTSRGPDIMSFISDNLNSVIDIIIGFLLAIGSVVLGNFLYDAVRERRNRLRLDFETVQETERLGISVKCQRGYLTDARVRCNNMEYQWETSDGLTTRKSILAGDDPSVFYPFKHSATWIDAKNFSEELNGTPYSMFVYPEGSPIREAQCCSL